MKSKVNDFVRSINSVSNSRSLVSILEVYMESPSSIYNINNATNSNILSNINGIEMYFTPKSFAPFQVYRKPNVINYITFYELKTY